jgi:hypothetical protein
MSYKYMIDLCPFRVLGDNGSYGQGLIDLTANEIIERVIDVDDKMIKCQKRTLRLDDPEAQANFTRSSLSSQDRPL